MWYAVFAKHDRTRWPTFDFPAHKLKTTNIFHTSEQAHTFMTGMSLGSDWQVGELPEDEIVEWLEKNQAMGITHVVIDCNPADRGHKMKPIAELLAQVADDRDGQCPYCGKKCRAIGQQLEPGDLPVFDRDTFNRTAIWCSTCRRVFCGQCLKPGMMGALGNCPKCTGQTAYATKSQWAYNSQ